MDKKTLKKQFKEYLMAPSEAKLDQIIGSLRSYGEKVIPCPICGSTNTIKFGTNPRKEGRVQQYRCKECTHIYSQTSVERRERMKKYPNCPVCNTNDVIRKGFDNYIGKRIKRKYQQYKCKRCNHLFYQKKNFFETDV